MRWTVLLILAACSHPAAPRPVAVASRTGAPASVATSDTCSDPESDLAMPDGDLATIDPAGVVRAIDGHRGELRRCYERYLKHDMHGGRVIATFAVRQDGKVSQVQMRGFAPALDRCLCSVVARVQFPAPRATAIVSYPMQFSGSL
jgi:hypothetical protein